MSIIISQPIRPTAANPPVPLSSLWTQLPAHVREPLLCVLTRILARQLQTPALVKGDHHDDTKHN